MFSTKVARVSCSQKLQLLLKVLNIQLHVAAPVIAILKVKVSSVSITFKTLKHYFQEMVFKVI